MAATTSSQPSAPYRAAADLTPQELDALVGSRRPRVGTLRDASRPTRGAAMYGLDDLVGMPLFDWQRDIADVALEVISPSPGGERWAHRTVGVVVARQNGKTTVAARRVLAGLFILGDGLILHTAQDRAVPRETFDEVAHLIEDTPALRKYRKRIRFANGQEVIELVDGSAYRILAPTQQAFRGWPRCGLLFIDEIREHRDDAVLSSALYTQRSHPNPQTWFTSNAGDPDSIVLNRLRDRGHDGDPTLAYFEWSAHPDREIDDVDGWIEANPSLGATIRGGTLLDEMRTDDPNRFRTEGLCQWVDVTTSHAIDFSAWTECADRDLEPIPEGSRVWAAIDIDGDRESAAFLAAAHVDGRLVVQLVESWEDGTDEAAIAATVEAFADQWVPETIGYDPNTCGGVVDRLDGRSIEFEKVTGSDWVVACGQLSDAVLTGTLVHPDQPDLNRQIAAAGRRDIGDGSWRMSRLDSSIPIPAAIALARLVHLAVRPGSEVGILVL